MPLPLDPAKNRAVHCFGIIGLAGMTCSAIPLSPFPHGTVRNRLLAGFNTDHSPVIWAT